jgi:DNA helicase IV
MSASPSAHPDLASEQAYIEKVKAAFSEQRARKRESPASGADKFAARKLREDALERLRDPVDPDALCFGRIDFEDERRYYLGRGAVHGDASDLLVVNWAAPKARPFFQATRSDPQGLRLRRRFQLQQLRLLGIIDDVLAENVSPDDTPAVVDGSGVKPSVGEIPAVRMTSGRQPAIGVSESDAKTPAGRPTEGAPRYEVVATREPPVDNQLRDAILADMDLARGTEMRDIVATIEARQYELISDSIDGVLAIQGGPGTGKTAIALHRAAWLLFNHREELERAGVLVVGPNRAFMEYVSEVLPSLGETAVVQLPVDRLVDIEDVRIRMTDVPAAARLKGDPRMAEVMRLAVRQRVRRPDADVELIVARVRIIIPRDEIDHAVDASWGLATNYVSARDEFRRALTRAALDHAPTGRGPFRHAVSIDEVEASLRGRGAAFDRIWPTVTAPEVLRDLLSSRQRMATAADGLLTEDERGLRPRARERQLRDEPWSAADMALLDEVDFAIRGSQSSFGYVLADEAQDLSSMQLRMIARRARQGRMTLVGDMAQATEPGHYDDWDSMVATVAGPDNRRVAELGIGYRVPAQIADLAAGLLPRIAPNLLTPRAVRLGPEDPRIVKVEEADLADELARQVTFRIDRERKTAVIVPAGELDAVRGVLTQAGVAVGDVLGDGLGRQITVLTAAQSKGLEFDHVILLEPANIAGPDEEWGYVYIAMTRATRTLTVIHSSPELFERPVVPEPDAALMLSVELESADPLPATTLGPRYTEALVQAKFVHAGQNRRGTHVPYLAHLQAVAALVLEDGGSEDEAIAALLHDSVEDSEPAFLDTIAIRFGVPVARIVAACTDPAPDESRTWRELKIEHMSTLETGGPQVSRVALAEKLDNARALLRDWRQIGDLVWRRMDVDSEDLLWYQQQLADLFVTERPGDLAWELRDTVEKLIDMVSAPEL